MQAGPTGAEGQGRGDALGERGPDATDPEAQANQVLADPWSRWASPSGGQEEEAGPFLVGVAEQPAMRIGGMVVTWAVHPATLASPSGPRLNNPGNYN
jgi:hypothetical protein